MRLHAGASLLRWGAGGGLRVFPWVRGCRPQPRPVPCAARCVLLAAPPGCQGDERSACSRHDSLAGPAAAAGLPSEGIHLLEKPGAQTVRRRGRRPCSLPAGCGAGFARGDGSATTTLALAARPRGARPTLMVSAAPRGASVWPPAPRCSPSSLQSGPSAHPAQVGDSVRGPWREGQGQGHPLASAGRVCRPRRLLGPVLAGTPAGAMAEAQAPSSAPPLSSLSAGAAVH